MDDLFEIRMYVKITEARFRHRENKKIKKAIVTLFLTILSLNFTILTISHNFQFKPCNFDFLTILRLNLANPDFFVTILSLNHTILTLFLAITSLHLAIMTLFSRKSEFTSRNYDFLLTIAGSHYTILPLFLTITSLHLTILTLFHII